MVNRMVFFYVYVIAERFTSDFGESLLPVLFSPTEPKNTPMIHDLIQDSQVESENKRKRSRNAPKGQRAHSPGHRPGLCACWAFSPLLKRLSATSEHLRLLE